MRIKIPRQASLDAVRITREGEAASRRRGRSNVSTQGIEGAGSQHAPHPAPIRMPPPTIWTCIHLRRDSFVFASSR